MVMITNVVSNKFRNLSIICALFVVIIHCRASFLERSTAWYLKEFLENGICEMAVPFFFLASGFFIAEKIGKFSWGVYKDELKKRLRSLVVPYFFWLVSYEVFMMVVQEKIYLPSYGEWGGDVFSCPFLTPLWYVRALLVLVVLSPAILVMLKRFPKTVLVFLWIIHALLCPYSPMPLWSRLNALFRFGPLPVLGLFYYAVGMAWRLELVPFSKVNGVFVFSVGVVLMIGRVALLDAGCGWAAVYLGFLGVPCLIYGLWQLIPGKSWPTWLVSCSFPVYVLHEFFYPIYCRIMLPVEGIWTYALMFSIVFFYSLVTTHIIRKLMPRVAKIAFGGR